jgi:putative molybdopterin biosynthesis protein
MNKEMLTTKNLAEYLGINQNQIYRLIKEKKIPATRITGKWLFPKELIDEWVNSSARQRIVPKKWRVSPERQVVVAGSNDLALEFLSQSANIRNPQFTVSLSSIGSLGGLTALHNGTCHIAASHLLDTDTGEYNSSYIRKSFPDLKVKLINLAYREQGLVVQKNNPLGIKNLKDLVGKKAAFINRQEGSGTRVLFDYGLKQNRIDPAEILGYTKTVHTHMEVALQVFRGSADAGIAVEAAARLLRLDFIPLSRERFDLVIPHEYYSTEPVRSLCDVLQSDVFKFNIARMGGYEIHDTGKLVFET